VSFSIVLLSMRDEGSEDAVASDSDYRLRSSGKIDSFVSWSYEGSPPRCILGLHPGNVLPDILEGENPAVAQTLGN